MTLKDSTALVTGGGRGIGRAAAEALAASGADVVVNYLADEAAASRTVAGIRASGGGPGRYRRTWRTPVRWRPCSRRHGASSATVSTSW